MKVSKIDDFSKTIPVLKGKGHWENGEPKGAFKNFAIHIISQGCFTLEEYKYAMQKRYPDASINTINFQIRHGTNLNGIPEDKRRLPYMVVKDKNGILSFDRRYPAGTW